MSCLSGTQIKLHLELFGIGDNTFCLRIVVGITVGKCQHAILQINWTQTRNIQVPIVQIIQVCMGGGIWAHRYGDTAHPYILFIVGIGHPEVAVLGDAITFLNTTYILRTIALVLSTVSEGCHLSIDKIQRRIIESVLTQRDGEWPTIFGRIIDGSVSAVGKTLSPDFRIRIHKSRCTVAF